MKRSLVLFGLGAGLAAVAAPVLAAPPGTNFNKAADSVDFCDGAPGTGNDLVVHYPATLWPPNHKYFEDIYVTATDGNDGPVDLVTTGTHNQYTDTNTGEEQNGAGNTANDITVDEGETATPTTDSTAGVPAYDEAGTGSVTTNWKARAERSGHVSTAASGGREYTLTGMAAYSDGSKCSASVTIVVPHDMSPKYTGRTTGQG